MYSVENMDVLKINADDNDDASVAIYANGKSDK